MPIIEVLYILKIYINVKIEYIYFVEINLNF